MTTVSDSPPTPVDDLPLRTGYWVDYRKAGRYRGMYRAPVAPERGEDWWAQNWPWSLMSFGPEDVSRFRHAWNHKVVEED